MPADKKRSPASRRRRTLRVCRKAVLLFLLVVVSLVVYLNQIGLPEFLKKPLVAGLERRGFTADFGRLRWRWHQGFVLENLVVHRRDGAGGPEFHSGEAGIRFGIDLQPAPAWRLTSLQIRGGQFSWVLPAGSGLSPLVVDDIEADLAMDPDGELDLQYFASRFRNLQLKVSGTFAHPGALPRRPQTNTLPRNLELLNRTMLQVANYVTNFEFSAEPTLQLRFRADAADWDALRADLEISLPEATTPWGAMEGFQLRASLRPPSVTNTEPQGSIRLQGRSVDTPWGRMEDWRADTLTVPAVQLPQNSSNRVHLVFSRLITPWGELENGSARVMARALDSGRPSEIDLELGLEGEHLRTSQGTADQVRLQTQGTINRTNAFPVRGTHELEVHNLQTTNLAARVLRCSITHSPAAAGTVSADASWGFWQQLQPHLLDFEVRGEEMTARGAELGLLHLVGSWQAPRLELRSVRGELYKGDAQATLTIDVPSREIQASADVAFDLHGLDPVFSERFRNWFAAYQWEGTPHASVSGRLRWPDWHNFKPDWREEVIPTVGFSGRFRVQDARYKGIPGREASSDFHFTNYIWHLPNLTIQRPEGRTLAVYDGDERTRDYTWQIVSDIDPQVLKPLLADAQQRIFDSFTNHATPHVEGTIWGRWRSHDRIGFRARVVAPGLELRGEQTDLATATVEYTNRFLTIRDLEIRQSNRVGRAESLGLDLPGNVMYFTNVDSGLPPFSVARAIGPVTARSVLPYVFSEPPQIRVNGRLGLKGHDATDLHFGVEGGPFHWWRFSLEQIRGDLHWQSNSLELADVMGRFYSGGAEGGGTFQFFTNDRPTEFGFRVTTTNAHLQALVRDVFSKTNRLEGALSGTLDVTAGRADSLDTWQGFGQMTLRDGVVWDIPIFGIFSPVFNAISPGLGQSRADEAQAAFTLVNGTIISRDLQVRSAEFSMLYQGSVDFLGNIDARMQARILKDSGALGPLISAVLWPLTKIFEYRLTGTVAEPVAEPIHIPKFLLMALEPFKALQGVLKSVGEAVNPKIEAPEAAPADPGEK